MYQRLHGYVDVVVGLDVIHANESGEVLFVAEVVGVDDILVQGVHLLPSICWVHRVLLGALVVWGGRCRVNLPLYRRLFDQRSRNFQEGNRRRG